jgi:hypothetical protein
MSQRDALFGAIHDAGRGVIPGIEDETNEHAANGVLVVQIRRLGTISGEIPEVARKAKLMGCAILDRSAFPKRGLC